MSRPVLLDHSIIGQHLTTLTIRKDREFAGCRICGAIFQSKLNTDVCDEEYVLDPDIRLAAHLETETWRRRHNLTHSEKEHLQFKESGRTFTPEAAHKLVPFGLVPVNDAQDEEVAAAMLAAPRAPVNDVEQLTKLSVLL